MEINFEKVMGTSEQVHNLFGLLRERQFNISHFVLPSFLEHTEFVINHPYRAWYLVKEADLVVGSIYITDHNTIGLYLKNTKKAIVQGCLSFVLQNYFPLPPIRSIRAQNFSVNVPVDHFELNNIMKDLEWKAVQITHSLL